MTKDNYIWAINRTNDRETLNGIRADVIQDSSLHGVEVDEVLTALNNKFAALNCQKRMPLISRKLLPVLIFVISVGVTIGGVWTAAGALPPKTQLTGAPAFHVSVCDGGIQASRDASRLNRRLAALSLLESGNDDNAHGRAGEVSRFQIMPGVWRKYFLVIKRPEWSPDMLRSAANNPFTARNVAILIMRDRCAAWNRTHPVPVNDYGFYLLWARPALLLGHDTRLSHSLMDRAQRFSNLVSSNHQL